MSIKRGTMCIIMFIDIPTERGPIQDCEDRDRTGYPLCLDTGGFAVSRLKNETSQLNLWEQSEHHGWR